MPTGTPGALRALVGTFVVLWAPVGRDGTLQALFAGLKGGAAGDEGEARHTIDAHGG